MKTSTGSRIIIALVVIAALALTGLVLPLLLSRSTSSTLAPGQIAPAAQKSAPNNTALALPTPSGARAVRGSVRTSPIPVTQAISVAVTSGATDAPLAMEMVSAAYTASGKPTSGCTQIDNSFQAQRFDFAVNVINHTGADLGPGDWGAQAYSGNEPLTLCYFGQTAQLPTLTNGAKTSVALVVFTGAGKAVSSVVIGTSAGQEARVCFAGDKVITCN